MRRRPYQGTRAELAALQRAMLRAHPVAVERLRLMYHNDPDKLAELEAVLLPAPVEKVQP